MIYINWLVLAVYIVVIIITMITVLMDNKQPAKTMAWMLVLIFMPVLGIVLYFFFGQNTRKERIINQKSLDQLTRRSMLEFVEQKNLKLPEKHKTIIALFASQNRALPFKDNEVDIYTDGSSFFMALLHEIGKAKHHIHLDIYIFEDDSLGCLIADALIDKARQGVEVRIIYDDVGNWKVKNSFYERMRDGGIEVHAFMPVKFPAFTSKMNYRNHQKICVIDGRTGFIGGMNIAERYVKGSKYGRWRDTHLKITGGAVYGLQKAFLIDWYFVDRTLITDNKYYPEINISANDCIAQIVTSSPISEWPDIMQGYVRIILEAKNYVYMESPYFLPTEPILFAMRTAALSGVDVRIILPMHTDSKIVEWASRSYMSEAAEAGVSIYMYSEGFLHSKLLVADDTLCSCGSTNVDFRSFENNFESNAFFYDADMALRMKHIFNEDIRKSVTLASFMKKNRRPFLQRLWESSIRLLSPLL